MSNINACQAVADAVKTTLGPRGMDKLVFDGRKVTISNDGATIMKLLEVAHPAAKTLVDISMSQVCLHVYIFEFPCRVYTYTASMFFLFHIILVINI